MDATTNPELDAATGGMGGSLTGGTGGSPMGTMDGSLMGTEGGPSGDGDGSSNGLDATTQVDECEPGQLRCSGKELAMCGDAGDALQIVDRCSDRGERCVDEACAAVTPGTRVWEDSYESPGSDQALELVVDQQGIAIASISLSSYTTMVDDAGVTSMVSGRLLRSYDANGWVIAEHAAGSELGHFFALDANGDQLFFRTPRNRPSSILYDLEMSRRDPSGVLRWTRTVGEEWLEGRVEDVAVAPDGNLYVCLTLSLDTLHVLKVSPEGLLLREMDLGDSGARTHCAADPESHAVASYSRPGATNDVWVQELDDDATAVAWDYTFDSGGDEGTSGLAVGPDGSTYVIGTVYEDHGWLRKLDASGDELWSRMLPGVDTVPSDVAIDPATNDVVIVFGTVDAQGDSLANVRKYDAEGTELWTATEGAAGVQAWPADVAIAPDGDVVVLGMKDLGQGADYDIWIARYAP